MAAPDGRLRALQVVLAVGAVLVVSAGAALVAGTGGVVARAGLLLAAAAGAAGSLRAARSGLRNSAETFAACAVGLGLAGVQVGRAALAVVGPLALAAAFLLVHRWARPVATWPLAAWAAGQLAALHAVPLLPRPLHTALFLGVALAGLSFALVGRPWVARVALISTVPWWAAGVVTGTRTAWTADAGERWIATVLLIGAGGGLLLARLRRALDPLTGPPRAFPVLAGGVSAAGLTGSFAALGVVGTTAGAYLGVLLAALAATVLDGWPRGLFLPVALTCGSGVALLSIGLLAQAHSWGALSLLLALTAAPAVLVAGRRREDRAVAAPIAVGCLTGSILLALPAGLLTPTGAAVMPTALYAMATLAGPELAPGVRQPTEATAAVAGVAAALVLVAAREWAVLATVLAVQGLGTTSWAWRTRPGGGPEGGRVWRAGAAQLVLAAWLGTTTAQLHLLEAYTLPLAAGLLFAGGPRLVDGPSWPAWGPALLVAAVPSSVLAILAPGALRPVIVLMAAAALLLAGAWSGLRAPLMVGAGTAVVVGLGLSASTLPWPVTAALALGTVLLAVGARRERSPVAFFGYRLADLR